MVIPRTPGDVTAEWLSAVLDTRVTEVQAEPLESLGFTGPIARLHLGGDASLPATLFAKFPDPGISVLEPRHHQRELDVYRFGLPRAGVRAAALYYGRIAGDGQGVVLLEDVRGRTGDPFGTIGPEAAGAIVDELARLHAAWWRCDDQPWIARPQLDPVAMQPAFAEAMAALRAADWFGRFPEPLIELIPSLAEGYARIVGRMLEGPHALLHADLNADNIMLPDGRQPMLIDWQLAHILPVSFDVAQLLACTLTVTERRTHETALLDRYQRGLAALGAAYDRDQLEADYRVALLQRLMILLRVWSERGPDGREAPFFEHFLKEQRVLTAVLDHDALARLD